MPWIHQFDADRAASRATSALRHADDDLSSLIDLEVESVRRLFCGVLIGSAPSQVLWDALSQVKRAGGAALVLLVDPRPPLDPWSILARGARDALVWGGDPDPVLARLARLQEVERLVDSPDVAGVMVGCSHALRQALRELVTAARWGSGPVLILGETGTGKELAARLVHTLGPNRRRGELVVVDCTTITPTLSGSELFGHERGAFTGAVGVRTGACAAADGGTLFLDEIGDLPLDLQPELLRLVQEGSYKRVGSDQWRTSRFRLVCATHRDLAAELSAGRFRADFYYRVAASVVRLPPLAERAGDVVTLFQYFFEQARAAPGPVELTPAVEEVLRTRTYPGNLRDLRQLALRTSSRYVGPGPVTPGDLPPEDRPTGHGAPPRVSATDSDDVDSRDRHRVTLLQWIGAQLDAGVGLKELRNLIADGAVDEALDRSGGNVRAAAALLGVTERALHLRRSQRRVST